MNTKDSHFDGMNTEIMARGTSIAKFYFALFTDEINLTCTTVDKDLFWSSFLGLI